NLLHWLQCSKLGALTCQRSSLSVTAVTRLLRRCCSCRSSLRISITALPSIPCSTRPTANSSNERAEVSRGSISAFKTTANDMKLIAISRVKNEADIIEAFVRHHAQHFDTLIVLDDGSTDSTYGILQSLLAEGIPLTLLREASVGNEQARYMTRLL